MRTEYLNGKSIKKLSDENNIKYNTVSAIIHNINLFIEPIRKELKTREWRNVIKHCT